MEHFFEWAVPVWLSGLQREKNITAGLYTAISTPKKEAVLRIATSGFYRVFADGRFVCYGPARCAHGYYRVDEVALPQDCEHVALEVVNYYINGFAALM